MGQEFWCRGPALSVRFTTRDFPTLQPRYALDEDFASLVQAQIELTTLFGNAHHMLFGSRARTAEMMLRGDYTKYIDDARCAIQGWKRAWGRLAVSSHLKGYLALMREYLKLYVNAFAFQAVLYRSAKRPAADEGQMGDGGRVDVVFPDSLMASPDGRSIYEAIGAAERLLQIFIDQIDPEKHLRYMPTRFYL